MNSSYIENIIDYQINEYKTYDTTNVQELSDEDVIIKHKQDGVFFIKSPKANQTILNRLNIILPYFNNSIKQHVPVDNDVIVCLGDLPKKSYNTKCLFLCFSKLKNTNAILIPNVDFFTGHLYRSLRDTDQDINFENKKDGSFFAGSTTGKLENNTRILYSLACSDKNNHHGYISYLLQYPIEEIINRYPNIRCLGGEIPIKEQLKYKILVNIDGNTLCWSRLYWQMKSNSIPVYINPSNEHVQFFDYMSKDDCYFSSTLENCFDVYDYILDSKNHEHVSQVIRNGHTYCDKLFSEYIKNQNTYLQNIIDSILIKFFHK